MKAILFLGSSLIGAQYMRESMALLDAKPIFLIDINDYSADPRAAIEAEEYYDANINSTADVIRTIDDNMLLKKYDVIGITSFLDEVFQVVLEVAKKLNIQGPDQSLKILTDKSKVQEIIPEFSPACYRFTASTLSTEELEKFISKFKEEKEFVLKPGISAGAVGICVVNNNVSKLEILKRIEVENLDPEVEQSWLLQQRVAGRLYSLEGYVKKGEVSFIGFASRVRKQLTELVNEYPADQDISIVIQEQCKLAVSTLVARSNYRFGYFHCEFIIGEENCYLIDANMGRLHGGAFVQYLALYHKLEPEKILQHVVDLGLFKGKHTENFNYTTHDAGKERTIAINYCVKEEGVIDDIITPNDFKSFHTRLISNGKSVLAVGKSDCSWVGFIAGFKEQVLADIERIVVKINGKSVVPFYTFEED